MSRTIDMEDPGSWTEEDRRYLQDRGQLPADADNVFTKGVQPGSAPLGENYGDVHTWPPQDNEHEVMLGGKYKEYREMTQDDLKGLLRDRQLPVTGTKGELIYRLLEDDDTEVDEEFDEGATE